MTIDTQSLQALWKQAFGDSDGFIAGFFRTGFSPDRCRYLTEKGQPTAALYWFDCTWQGKKIAYLYAVATEERHRGQGLCRRLMTDTHRHLQKAGYAGAVLVPGSEDLFRLYEKLGYVPFSPVEKITVPAGTASARLSPVTPEEYAAQQTRYLPHGAVVHTETALSFLSAFAEFYAGEDFLFSAAQEGDTLFFQEYLGAPEKLPGIIKALGGAKGVVRLPGRGTPLAMFHSLTDDPALPAYFGIPLD